MRVPFVTTTMRCHRESVKFTAELSTYHASLETQMPALNPRRKTPVPLLPFKIIKCGEDLVLCRNIVGSPGTAEKPGLSFGSIQSMD
jgi:hypothetical protein